MADTLRERLEEALGDSDPIAAARRLATRLRDEGLSQPELYRLYVERFSVADAGDLKYDALQESLDIIAGGSWAKGGDLYPGGEYVPPSEPSGD